MLKNEFDESDVKWLVWVSLSEKNFNRSVDFGKQVIERKSLHISAGSTQGFQVTQIPQNSKQMFIRYP